MQKVLATIAVGFVVVLAGCSSVPFVGDSGTQQQELADDVKSSHQDALEESGSYSVSYTFEQTQAQNGQERSNTVNGSYAVNLDDGKALQTVQTSRANTARYTSGGTTYTQLKVNESMPAEDAVYQAASEPYNGSSGAVNTTQATGIQFLLTDNITYESAGTETYDGTDVTVFEADAESSSKAIKNEIEAQGGAQEVSIKDFSATLYLDSDGVVRYHSWSFSAQISQATVTYDVELDVTSVGDTTVEDPGWLTSAKQQTNMTSAG